MQTFFKQITLEGYKMTTEHIRLQLKDRKLSAVAQIIGINKHTLYRFVNGKTKPNPMTLKAISDYLERN